MKRSKTVISTQTQQPPVPAPGASVDSRYLSSRVRRVPRRPVARPEPTGPPDPPVLAQSVPIKDDPFRYLPPIYNPDADFVVDSAQSEIRKLLTPEPDDPTPASDLPISQKHGGDNGAEKTDEPGRDPMYSTDGVGSEYQTLIEPCEVPPTVPEGFNSTAAKLPACEKSKQTIDTEFTAKIEPINEQISKLPAIEDPPSEGAA